MDVCEYVLGAQRISRSFFTKLCVWRLEMACQITPSAASSSDCVRHEIYSKSFSSYSFSTFCS